MGKPTGRPPASSMKFKTPDTNRIKNLMMRRRNQKNAIYTKNWLLTVDSAKKPFADELFSTTFSKENLEKLINALKIATESEVSESPRLLKDDYLYSIQIVSHRVPHVPVHLSRITLPHSIDAEDSEVCLFVKDLKRGRRLDFEPTIKHYETMLKQKKIDLSKITIIPLNQLYNDFATYELRRKLAYLYDRFLVDKEIATHVNGFLGHKLLSKCRSAIPIDLNAQNLPDEINTSLRKVFYKHVNNGITQNVLIGRHSMSNEHICENFIDLVKQLVNIHPGGTENIYKLYLKPNVNVSVSVPVYVNLDQPVQLPKPEVAGKEKTINEASEKANETLDKFQVTKSGEIVQKKRSINAKQTPANSIIGNPMLAASDDDEDFSKDIDYENNGGDDNDDDDNGTEEATASTSQKQQPQQQQQQQRQQQQGKKKTKPTSANQINESDINDLILKNLKKLVGGGQEKMTSLTQKQKMGGNIGRGNQASQRVGRVGGGGGGGGNGGGMRRQMGGGGGGGGGGNNNNGNNRDTRRTGMGGGAGGSSNFNRGGNNRSGGRTDFGANRGMDFGNFGSSFAGTSSFGNNNGLGFSGGSLSSRMPNDFNSGVGGGGYGTSNSGGFGTSGNGGSFGNSNSNWGNRFN